MPSNNYSKNSVDEGRKPGQVISVVDQSIRDELLDIGESFIVQAPAGSGKTELLTQRILALLATVQKPESILAITFTRKAAAEMRERVVGALMLAQQAAPESSHELARWKLARQVLQTDKENSWNLIANPSRLNIYTIDALSANLSGALPLLSQTGTIPAIEDKAQRFYLQAAERMLTSIKDNDVVAQNIRTLLIHKDNNLKQVIELIAQLLGKRLQWLDRIDAADHQLTCERMFESLNIIIEEKLVSVYEAFPNDIISELPPLLEQAAQVLRKNENLKLSNLLMISDVDPIACPLGSDLVLWKAIAEMMLTASNTKPSFFKSPSKTNGFPLAKDADNKEQGEKFTNNKTILKEILQDLSENTSLAIALNEVRQLPENVDSDIENPVLRAVIELLPIAAGHLKLVFKEHNILDFSELSLSSLNALGCEDEPSDMALALDYQIEHILVDEFQDTSSPQIRLIELLTAGWDASSNKSLFLVGDPMQSIYRFRDANVSLFMQIAQSGVGQLRPKFRQLNVNFRSNRNIIDWVNHQFTHIMPDQDDLTLSAVSYAESIAFHPSLEASGVKCHVTLDADGYGQQAAQVLKVVQAHLKENLQLPTGTPPKTLAILARSRGHLVEIIEALNKLSISYQAVEIEPLMKKMVVSDITSLALALTDTYDQLSWVACFRSPWFGLNLNDIRIILARLRRSYKDIPSNLEEFILENEEQGGLSCGGHLRLKKLLPIILSALKHKGQKPFVKWLSGCFEAVGGLLQIDIPSEYQDLETCINTISEFETGGELIDRQGLNQALESLYAAPNPLADNQVQIMTIHKSKGLEFDRVILPRLDAKSMGVDSPLLKWTEILDRSGNSHRLLAVSKQTGLENDSIYRYINNIDQQKEKFERQRVLYVAATRAKSELYLFANISTDLKKTKKDDGGKVHFKKPVSNSFLGMLWDGINNDFEIIQTDSPSSKKPKPIDMAKMTESELASIDGLHDQSAQLNYIFPPRKVKQSNIEDLENASLKQNVSDLELKQQSNSDQVIDEATTQRDKNLFAKTVGTVIHRQLEWLSKQSLDKVIISDEWREITAGQLITGGLNRNPEEIALAVTMVERALNNTMNDEFGQFILSNHEQANSEMKIHKNISQGVFLTRIVDRTFVVDNVRWIVDYKSSEPAKGESLKSFLGKEVANYKSQIGEYVDMFKCLSNHKITAGLYFPLIQHFEKIYHD